MGCGTSSTKEEKIFESSRKTRDFKVKFEYLSNLGNGSICKVKCYRDTQIHGMKFAIKTIAKSNLNPELLSSLVAEINTLKQLDHPNIVKYFETYEDDSCIHIVMEYIPGDNLLQIIKQRKLASIKDKEKGACEIIKCLFKAVLFLHNKGIIHRDIKPENILFYNSAVFESLRLIDFGLSMNEDKDKEIKGKAVSPNYLSPEAILKKYSKKSDVWSIGVVLFVLLLGRHPFSSPDPEILKEKIRKAEYNSKLLEESQISNEAKELITKIFVVDEDNRISVEQCLLSSWIQKYEIREEESIKMTRNFLKKNSVIDNFKRFSKFSNFKKEILFYIAKMSYDEELLQIKKIFLDIDKDHTGTIEKEEVRHIFRKLGLVNEEELNIIWNSIDFHRDGTVNYTEFLASSLSSSFFLREDKLKYIFSFFTTSKDRDHITPKKIVSILKYNGIQVSDDDFLELFDKNIEKKINYEEFKKIMESAE